MILNRIFIKELLNLLKYVIICLVGGNARRRAKPSSTIIQCRESTDEISNY
jgi:thiosulfate reductase cytochrome b subunit